MFDLGLLASPARLKREFLATTEVAPQDMPPELAWEFAQLKEERPAPSGLDYVRTYPRHWWHWWRGDDSGCGASE